MLACLVTVWPLSGEPVKRVPIHLCSVADRQVTGLGGVCWEPAITEAPSIGMQFWNGDFEQGTDAGKVDFTINLEQASKAYPRIADVIWKGAHVAVAVQKLGTAWPWKTRFKGRVTSYAGSAWPAMKISASVDIEPFAVDVLNRSYAGTGDAEGGEDLKDKIKPLALGRPRNVEPVLIDAVESVYQFSGYGPIEAVEKLFERASAFPAASANYPTYAALVAATIQPGHWATCLAEGLIRLGAPAAGVITGDIRGHAIGGVAPRGAGALVRVMADICGVDDELLDLTALARLDAEGATNSDVMITEQVKFLDAVRRVILPCNWQVVVSNLGVLRAMKPQLSRQEAMIFHAQGRREPLVGEISEGAVSVPYKKTVMAAARSWRTHTLDEIASDVPLVLRGDYDPDTVYRAGNIVTMPGGSRWQYISGNPQMGVAPGSNPSVWVTLESAATYSDGTPIDDLQPAEPDAQITRTINVAETSLTFVLGPTGLPLVGQFPRTVRATVTEANYDATLSSEWSISVTGGVTATIDNTPSSPTRGVVSITNVTGPGTIEVRALRAGVALIATISVATKGMLADESEVTTDLVANGAITNSVQGSNGSIIVGSGDYVDVVSLTIDMGFAGNVILLGTIGQTYNDGNRPWGMRLVVDGAEINTVTGNSVQVSVALTGGTAAAQGLRTVKLQWLGHSTMQLNATGSSLVAFRSYR